MGDAGESVLNPIATANSAAPISPVNNDPLHFIVRLRIQGN